MSSETSWAGGLLSYPCGGSLAADTHKQMHTRHEACSKALQPEQRTSKAVFKVYPTAAADPTTMTVVSFTMSRNSSSGSTRSPFGPPRGDHAGAALPMRVFPWLL